MLGKGQSLKVDSLDSELASLRQSKQGHLAESLASKHLIMEEYQAWYHPESG